MIACLPENIAPNIEFLSLVRVDIEVSKIVPPTFNRTRPAKSMYIIGFVKRRLRIKKKDVKNKINACECECECEYIFMWTNLLDFE